MTSRNPIRPARLDHNDDTITVAVTFKWRRPWALDACEGSVLVGDLYRLLKKHYGDTEWDQLAGIESVLTWDQNEEQLCGRSLRPVTFDRKED